MSMRWAGVARLGGIGDNLIVASTLRPLKKLGYNVEVITSEFASVVYLNSPFVDKLSIKREGDIPTGPEWQKWFVARSNEYDVFAHLSHTGEVRHALFRDSTPFWWRPEYRRKICAGSYLETAHDIVGVPYDFGPTFFPTDHELEEQAIARTKIGGDYVAWVVAGSRPDKIYPASCMAIPRLIKELGCRVVLVGIGEKQGALAKHIETTVRQTNSSLNNLFATKSFGDPGFSVRRSLTTVLGASLVITPDTGAAWAVAMEPMPKIVLLSHASAENITKHWVNTTSLHADVNRVPCWPCHRLHDDMTTCTPSKDNPNAAACIDDIPVEKILKTADRLLQAVPLKPIKAGWLEAQ